jgi:hypothetical protein
MFKTQHVRGNTLKIYRVVYENGSTRSFWTSYRSAVGSAAQARCNARVEVAHVPDELFQPVDKREETRLSRLENLWYGLTVDDAEVALDRLQKLLQARRQWQARTSPAPVLSEVVRGEAEALLKLDRLVDAS